MAELCPVCGSKVGGVLGKPVPYDRLIKTGKGFGVYQENICLDCLQKAVNKATIEKQEFQPIKEEVSVNQKDLEPIFLSPSPVPEGAQDRGLVTGYCILGTGPLSALCSSVTDFLGAKSNVYLEKARIAEREALKSLKIEALKAGGDAVYCLRVNLTEATSGQGMLMVSVSGAATRTQNPSPEALAAMKLFE